MPTPTNSVLTREVSDETRISKLIYDNESLKIEVETLKEQLESSGALKIEDLRKDNERLKIENTQLQVQLEEKTAQLAHLQNSDTRFSNIDDSLKQLLQQIQAQRDELTELRLVGKEKDDKIIEQKVLLEKTAMQLAEAQEKYEVRVQSFKDDLQRAQEEKAAVEQQLDRVTAATQGSVENVQELEARLQQKEERVRQCEQELLALKEAAAAKSAVRGDRTSEQEKQIADLEQREVVAQEKIVSLERELAQTRERMSAMQRELQQQLAAATEAAHKEKERAVAVAVAAAVPASVAAIGGGAVGGTKVDLYAPEVKAYVERKVREAVADRDRRLQEQVDENAALLSRMALIQHESEEMIKKAGLSGRDVSAMNERVEARSKARGARNNMERRVADFLSSDTFSKKDVELLLQEMLDHQERTEEDISTSLLIKDMQAEEAEKTFRWNLKRLENENASLLKQLQKAAYASLQRHARADAEQHNTTSDNADATSAGVVAVGGGGGGTTTSAAAAATGFIAPAAPAGPGAPHNMNAGTGGNNISSNSTDGVFTDGRPNFAISEDATPMRSTAPQWNQQQPQWHQQQPQQQYPMNQTHPQQQYPMNQTPPLRQNPQPRVHFHDPSPTHNANTFASGSSGGMGQPVPLRPIEPSGFAPSPALTGGGGSQDPNRNLIVPCPACTYEQKYGNRRCEICETPLVLPRL